MIHTAATVSGIIGVVGTITLIVVLGIDLVLYLRAGSPLKWARGTGAQRRAAAAALLATVIVLAALVGGGLTLLDVLIA